MKNRTDALKREFKRLFRSMDFVSRHPALNRRGKEGERFAEIYQQLGMLWEFLALQCPHNAGWRKARNGKFACKVCGTLRRAQEHWVLLPRDGKKIVGSKLFPNSKASFPNKKAATLVNDTIWFHGAKVNVDVHNSYRSRLFSSSKRDIDVAAERIVRVEEGSVQCWLDTHLVKLTLKKHKRGERPPYGAFVFELPRRALKRFPLLVEFDQRGELVGVTVFRPSKEHVRAAQRQSN